MSTIRRIFLCGLLAAAVALAPLTVSAAAKEADFTPGDNSIVEIRSNRHTGALSLKRAANRLSLENYEKMMTNDRLEVWFNAGLDAIRIVDRSNGYIWGGLPGEKGTDLNTGWSNFANAICSIDYYNAGSTQARISLADRNVRAGYDWEDDSVTVRFNAKKIGISFSFTLTLEEDSVRVAMVKGSLEETGDCRIKSMYFLPFLGSTYQDEIDGYLFIPDGCGALIRFSKSTTYISGFDGPVYGIDAYIDSTLESGSMMSNRSGNYLVPAGNVTVPVYGVAHGADQNAFLAVIEDGEEYAAVTASPAGVITDYNWAAARFDFRKMYTKTVTEGSSGIVVLQDKVNRMVPAVRFRFLAGEQADYVGMANCYRETLKEDKILGKERKNETVPLHLEVVNTTLTKGFLFRRVKKLTDTDDAEKMLRSLADRGVTGVTAVLRGWQKGSTDGGKYGNLRFSRKIGGKSGVNRVKKYLDGTDGKCYLYLDPVFSNEKQIYLSTDAAIGVSDNFISKSSADHTLMFVTKYFEKISRIDALLEKAQKKLSDYSLSIDSLGGQLYSDATKQAYCNRTSSMKAVTKMVKRTGGCGLYDPNLYCWKYTDDFFNIPMNNSQYLFETDTVPFLQMVLKGSVDYYSPFLNQGYCSESTVLKLVEYGAYPAYIVMQAENYEVENTAHSEYFSLCFGDWCDEIASVCEKIGKALLPFEGQSITGHTVLREGVVRVDYSGGGAVYVNYLKTPVTADGVTVPALGFKTVAG